MQTGSLDQATTPGEFEEVIRLLRPEDVRERPQLRIHRWGIRRQLTIATTTTTSPISPAAHRIPLSDVRREAFGNEPSFHLS